MAIKFADLEGNLVENINITKLLDNGFIQSNLYEDNCVAVVIENLVNIKYIQVVESEEEYKQLVNQYKNISTITVELWKSPVNLNYLKQTFNH